MENPDLVFQVTGDSQIRNIAGRLNVIAEKLSRLGQTIQTEWIASWWHQPQVDLFATRLNKLPHFVPSLGSGCTQSALGGSGPICLPTGSHLGQSGGEVAGLPMQEKYCDCSRVAQHALVLGPSGHVKSDPSVPNLLTKPYNQILHRNLSNMNLHAWLLDL